MYLSPIKIKARKALVDDDFRENAGMEVAI